MGRPRLAKHPRPDEHTPENESQEQPEQHETEALDAGERHRNDAPTPPEREQFTLSPPANDNQPISKANAVREALAEGLEAPGDIAAFIEKRHGIVIPKQMVSSYKAQQRARDAKAAGGEIHPRTHAPQPVGIPAGFGTDVMAIRELIERLGGIDMFKETVTQLSGLLSKYGAGGLTEIADAIG